MAVGLTVAKIDQRSERSHHRKINYNLIKMQFRTIYNTDLECILNGLVCTLQVLPVVTVIGFH